VTHLHHSDPSASRTPIQAVIFDLWGTLIPFPAAKATELVARMAAPLGAPADAFARAWAGDFTAPASSHGPTGWRRSSGKALGPSGAAAADDQPLSFSA
jgi:hypothetical protein